MAKKFMDLAQGAAPTVARAAAAAKPATVAAARAQAKAAAKATPAQKPTRKFPELTPAQRALHGGITANRDAFTIEAAKARLATAVATKK